MSHGSTLVYSRLHSMEFNINFTLTFKSIERIVKLNETREAPEGGAMLFQSHTTANAMSSRYVTTHSEGRVLRTARTSRTIRWTRRIFRPVIRPAVSL